MITAAAAANQNENQVVQRIGKATDGVRTGSD